MRSVVRVVVALTVACAGVLSLLSACNDQPTPLEPKESSQPASSPSFSIWDGMNNGFDHFYFLPPMVGTPSYGGTFDALATPIAEVCMLDGSDCAAVQPAGFPVRFTMESGPGSETIRVGDEHYIVNWHTDQFDLTSGSGYRVSVFLDGCLLGYADVDVVNGGKDLKSVDTGEYIGLVDGRTLPIKFRIEEGVGSTLGVGPEGGVLNFCNGVVLDVPPGAVAEWTLLTVTDLEADYGPLLTTRILPDGNKRVLGGFKGRPDGLEFALPVKATIPVVSPESPENLVFPFYVSAEGGLSWLSTDLSYDPTTESVNFDITHFSENGAGEAANHEAQPRACSFTVAIATYDYQVAHPGSGTECQVILSEIDIEYYSDCPDLVSVKGDRQMIVDELCGEDPQFSVTIDPVFKLLEKGAEQSFSGKIYFTSKTVTEPTLLSSAPNWAIAQGQEHISLQVDEAGGLATVTGTSVGDAWLEAYAFSPGTDPRASAHIEVYPGARPVDIALVFESSHSNWAYMGMPEWGCDADVCVGYRKDHPTKRVATFWGVCLDGAGSQVEAVAGASGVIAISLSEEGPFSQGPIDIPLTCNDQLIARSQDLWILPTGPGEGTYEYCAVPLNGVCQAIDVNQVTVGTAYQEPPPWGPQFRQVGPKIAAALEERFPDGFRLAGTAFGSWPDFAASCESGYYMTHEYEYWDTAEFRDFLDFTADAEAIASATASLAPICDDRRNYEEYMGHSVYSAAIHAIRDFEWRENAYRAVIVHSQTPACRYYSAGDYCDAEPKTDFTKEHVVEAALEKGVALFMLNMGWHSNMDHMRGPFKYMADNTDGWYTEDKSTLWPVLTLLEAAFDQVALAKQESEQSAP